MFKWLRELFVGPAPKPVEPLLVQPEPVAIVSEPEVKPVKPKRKPAAKKAPEPVVSKKPRGRPRKNG